MKYHKAKIKKHELSRLIDDLAGLEIEFPIKYDSETNSIIIYNEDCETRIELEDF